MSKPMPNSPQLRDAPPEFHDRIQRLIAANHTHLTDARFRLQVRDTIPVLQHATTWGEVDTPNNDAEASQYDFSIWFALDAWKLLNEFQRDALTEHELFHCSWDDNGKPLLIPHSIEEFNGVLARYGLWWPDSAETRAAIMQMLAPDGAEGVKTMPQGYQRPFQGGSSGSTGAGGSSGSTGAGGSSGSTGAGGSSGSTGAFAQGTAVWTDPDLQPGDNFYTVDLGGGRHIELSKPAYDAAVASIMADQAAGV